MFFPLSPTPCKNGTHLASLIRSARWRISCDSLIFIRLHSHPWPVSMYRTSLTLHVPFACLRRELLFLHPYTCDGASGLHSSKTRMRRCHSARLLPRPRLESGCASFLFGHTCCCTPIPTLHMPSCPVPSYSSTHSVYLQVQAHRYMCLLTPHRSMTIMDGWLHVGTGHATCS